MTTSLAFTHVTVGDIDEALGFYSGALGLIVHNDVASPAGRWVTIGSDAQPGVSVVLSQPHAGRAPADADAIQELLAKGSLPMVGFATDDVDALFETVRASGAEVLQEPMDQPWGPRDCAFRDPSGNTVRITAESAER
jgi:catechol 2,3-dioxygenase-like lactoylglutathione lyase family enzyme